MARMIPIAIVVLGAVWVASNRPFTSWREAVALYLTFAAAPAAAAFLF